MVMGCGEKKLEWPKLPCLGAPGAMTNIYNSRSTYSNHLSALYTLILQTSFLEAPFGSNGTPNTCIPLALMATNQLRLHFHSSPPATAFFKSRICASTTALEYSLETIHTEAFAMYTHLICHGLTLAASQISRPRPKEHRNHANRLCRDGRS